MYIILKKRFPVNHAPGRSAGKTGDAPRPAFDPVRADTAFYTKFCTSRHPLKTVVPSRFPGTRRTVRGGFSTRFTSLRGFVFPMRRRAEKRGKKGGFEHPAGALHIFHIFGNPLSTSGPFEILFPFPGFVVYFACEKFRGRCVFLCGTFQIRAVLLFSACRRRRPLL